MSDGYTKLFSSLIHSTVWQEDAFVKVVWITMLAMADRDGVVQASAPGLAKAAGVPLDACEAALSKFMAPDQYSRTPDNEGRRIAKVAGGWELLNYMKYRRLMDADDQRGKTAVRVRKFRERNALKRPVTLSNECNDIAKAKAKAEAEAEAKADSGSLGGGDKTLEVVASGGRGGSARKRASAPNAHRIHDTWEPDPARNSVRELTDRFVASGGDVRLAIMEYRNHWLNAKRDALKSDWNMAWANRLIRLLEYRERPSSRQPIAKQQTAHERSVEASRRLIAEAEARERQEAS